MERVFSVFGYFALLGLIFMFMFYPIIFIFMTIFGSYIDIQNPFDYARITDVEYKAVLLDEPENSGNLLITERLTYDIHAASKNNLFWELWRDLPESTLDGLKIDYDVLSVKEIDENGNAIPYRESSKLYWDDSDYVNPPYGPGKWYHSTGPYDGYHYFECLLFYVDGIYRDEITFEIQYIMNNAAFRYGDVSELYVSMFSGDDVKYLDSFKAEILVNKKDMPSKGNYEFYTYGTNSNEFAYEESDTMNPGYHTFYMDLDKKDLKFKSYNEYLEFTLWGFGNDKHKFTDYASYNNDYSNNVLNELRNGKLEYDNKFIEAKKEKFEILIICIGVSILVIYFVKHKIKSIDKNKFFKPTQDITYFRDIPSDLDPYFASKFVFCKSSKKASDNDGYSAILLSLVRKKYINIVKVDQNKDWSTRNTNIILNYDGIKISNMINTNNTVLSSNNLNNNQINVNMNNTEINLNNNLESLTDTERAYFNLILRHARYSNSNTNINNNMSITMDRFQEKILVDRNNTDSFVRILEKAFTNIGIKLGYLQDIKYDSIRNSLKSSASFLNIVGWIVLIVGNIYSNQGYHGYAYGAYFILGLTLILSGVWLKRKSNKYILLSQLGEDEYSKWYGLYNFLNSETLMNEKTIIDLPLWEKYLVYATAFGIADKVNKALEIRCPDVQIRQSSPILSNRFYTSTNFRSYSSHIHSSTRFASSSARSLSRGSYGGGGRGGGGGGGGH